MTRHLKLHYGIKPYECDFCDKSFARKSDLESHRLLHEGKRPFKCSWIGCGKAFARNSDMKAHEKRHELKTKKQKLSSDCLARKEEIVECVKMEEIVDTVSTITCTEIMPPKPPISPFEPLLDFKDDPLNNKSNFFQLEPFLDMTEKPMLLQHDDHWDFLAKDGRLLHFNDGDPIEHKFEPFSFASAGDVVHHNHQHGEKCGHRVVQHGDHVDFVVGDELHYIHDDHCHLHGNLQITSLEWDDVFSFIGEDPSFSFTNQNQREK